MINNINGCKTPVIGAVLYMICLFGGMIRGWLHHFAQFWGNSVLVCFANNSNYITYASLNVLIDSGMWISAPQIGLCVMCHRDSSTILALSTGHSMQIWSPRDGR
eukprot:349042_1